VSPSTLWPVAESSSFLPLSVNPSKVSKRITHVQEGNDDQPRGGTLVDAYFRQVPTIFCSTSVRNSNTSISRRVTSQGSKGEIALEVASPRIKYPPSWR